MTNPIVTFPAPREVVVEDDEMPVPGDGQVLIRTRRSLISTGTELTLFTGDFAEDSIWASLAEFPMRPGYSNVGEVVATGAGVDPALRGRRVASHSSHARYVLADARVQDHRALRFIERNDVRDDEATFFTLAETAMNGVRRAGVRLGDAVVVYGLGIVGQLVVRLCRLAGARPVLAVDVAEQRLALLPDDELVLPILGARTSVAELVRDATGGRMADVVFEVTGNSRIIAEELLPLRKQGRFVVLGSPRGEPAPFDFHDLCNWPSFTIIGAHYFSHPPTETPENPWTAPRHAELFFDLLADGELRLGQLISHRLRYSRAPDAYRMLADRRSEALGVILEWDGPEAEGS